MRCVISDLRHCVGAINVLGGRNLRSVLRASLIWREHRKSKAVVDLAQPHGALFLSSGGAYDVLHAPAAAPASAMLRVHLRCGKRALLLA